MTATVTEIGQAPSVRHDWLKQPRADNPNRHIRTCRRPQCGLKRRSEQHPDTGRWGYLWLWPEGESGSTFDGASVPSCRGERASKPKPAAPLTAEPAPVEVSTPPCCRCATPGVPPCGPTRLYLGGPYCEFQAGLITAARTTNGDVA